MTSSFIGAYTYNDYCRKVRYGDSSLTVDSLTSICEFLDGKQYDDNGRIIQNVLDDFIYQIVRKPSYSPEYSPNILSFIKSDYYSNKVKSDIYKMTKQLEGYDNINKLLNSDLNINDFDLLSLNDINDAFYEYSERKKMDKDINVKIPIIFNKYMFVLDGEGPVDYIINNYSEKELGKEFLINAGLVPNSDFYKNRKLSRLELCEEHLIAIYKNFEKYLPDKKDEFIKFIKHNKSFVPKDFISNYLMFVNNDFSSDFLKNTNNSTESKEEYLVESITDQKINNGIRNEFLKYINKDKKILQKSIR